MGVFVGIAEIIVLGIGLSSDAFAVSICKGLSSKQKVIRTGLVCGAWFGIFQALMPTLGWALGAAVSRYTQRFSAYIAFAILSFLGAKMIFEALGERRREKALGEKGISEIPPEADGGLGARVMVALAAATSIDALAAGISLAAVGFNAFQLIFAVSVIGILTFTLSFIGSAAGAAIGARLKTGAQIAGGAILIIIGVKILVEYLLKK